MFTFCLFIRPSTLSCILVSRLERMDTFVLVQLWCTFLVVVFFTYDVQSTVEELVRKGGGRFQLTLFSRRFILAR